MTQQYNVPIKILNEESRGRIQTALQPYGNFSERGNLRGVFSREYLLYVGEVIVYKTNSKELASEAQEILKTIEGLVVLPITESDEKGRCTDFQEKPRS
jgi:hypothetical protein